MQEYWELGRDLAPILWLYMPIGLIGLWRWTSWVVKKVVATRYRTVPAGYHSSVSIVTPVYNEEPTFFRQALESWKANHPNEIIAVIDHSDKQCIKVFREFAKTTPGSQLIVTKTPGKREALRDGIIKAKSEITALVDSDTKWEDITLREAIAPFGDPEVSGVATNQQVLEPKTVAQRLFAIQLYLRFSIEMPFLQVSSGVQSCLSGRTALYRTRVLKKFADALVEEYFFGKKAISGDDKRLTYLIEAAGEKVYFQSTAKVYTPGAAEMRTFWKQRLRWSRNAGRADLKALRDGWVWNYPVFGWFLLDRALQPFALLLGPIFAAISIVLGLYLPAILIFVWWFFSRGVKLGGYFLKQPKEVGILPVYVVANFLNALVRIYAISTIHRQGWITRWDKGRLQNWSWLRSVPAYGTSLAMVGVLVGGAAMYKVQNFSTLPLGQKLVQAQDFSSRPTDAELLTNWTMPEKQMIRRHEVVPGDSIHTLTETYRVPAETILSANLPQLPSWDNLTVGMILSIPLAGYELEPNDRYRFSKESGDRLLVFYDPIEDAVTVKGRGQQVSLGQVRELMGDDYIEDLGQGEWLVKKSILVTTGATLVVDSSEAQWVKLASDPSGYTSLRTNSGNLLFDGVKVTSWDVEEESFDTKLEDGRSYVLAKNGARLDIYSSELAYLGFPLEYNTKGDASPYGVSWRMSQGYLGKYLLTGEVMNSQFHDNYFGMYMFGATGVVVKDNQFFNNLEYGFDPHDDSTWLWVEGNDSFDNGNHGIIFSINCANNMIVNNRSFNNAEHGIMLHETSDNNWVVGNEVFGNKDGIVLYGSSRNTITHNLVHDNEKGLRVNEGSKGNRVIENKFEQNEDYGIYLYEDSGENVVMRNMIGENERGIYVKTSGNYIGKNMVTNNRIGIELVTNAQENWLWENEVTENRLYGMLIRGSSGSGNKVGENLVADNLFNILAH